MNDLTETTLPDAVGQHDWLTRRLRPGGDHEAGCDFLRSSGITDPSIIAAYRIASVPADFEVGGKRVGENGVTIPTFDPRNPIHPVGCIRCWNPSNRHRFVTEPAGLIVPADIADHRRVVLTDAPMLCLRLAQAGVRGVTCAETHNVLPLYADWLASRELVVVASRAPWVEALKQAITDLGLQSEGIQVHADLPRSNPEALAALGLDKAALNPPVEGTITPLLIRDLADFAQARVAEGIGLDALKSANADSPEFVEAYGIGFLPPGFREALDTSSRAALYKRRIENAIIVPAYDQAGTVIDLLAVHPEGHGGSTHVCLSDHPIGLIAPKVASSFEEIVVTDSFRLAASMFKSGKRNTMLFRGIEDLRANIERLWRAGVRHADVMFRRSAAEAVAALDAAGIVAENCGIPRSFDGREKKCPPPMKAEPKRLILQAEPSAAALEAEPDFDHAGSSAAPKIAEAQTVEPPAALAVRLELLKHDTRLQQATFKAGEATYISEIPFDNSAKLAVEIKNGDKFHRDRFDLNSEAQRKRFCTSGAMRTGVPFEAIGEHLLHLLDAVRGLQEEVLNPAKPKAPVAVMSDAERQEATAYLSRPDLLSSLAADMTALGLAGEDKLKRHLLLVLVSRLLDKPISAVLRAPSSSGKSHAIETLAVLAPPEDVVHLSSISGSSLRYQSDMRHKLLIIDEADALLPEVIVALRVLQSRGAITHSATGRDPLTGQTVANFTEARGPVAVLTSTTAADVDMEFLSRCYDLSIDTSPEQTERILETQRRMLAEPTQLGAEGKKAKIVSLHRNIHRLLRSGSSHVQVPFADRIRFPSASVKHRREQERFLGLIQASALLHQNQRLKKTEEGCIYVVADIRDYEIAVELAADSIGRAADELSAHARDVLSLIQSEKLATFDVNDLAKKRSEWTRHKLRTGLDELIALEVLSSPKRSRPRKYELITSAAAMLTAPQVRLLPASAFGDLATIGETGFANSSPQTATG